MKKISLVGLFSIFGMYVSTVQCAKYTITNSTKVYVANFTKPSAIRVALANANGSVTKIISFKPGETKEIDFGEHCVRYIKNPKYLKSPTYLQAQLGYTIPIPDWKNCGDAKFTLKGSRTKPQIVRAP